jgi:hypothetical protein
MRKRGPFCRTSVLIPAAADSARAVFGTRFRYWLKFGIDNSQDCVRVFQILHHMKIWPRILAMRGKHPGKSKYFWSRRNNYTKPW